MDLDDNQLPGDGVDAQGDSRVAALADGDHAIAYPPQGRGVQEGRPKKAGGRADTPPGGGSWSRPEGGAPPHKGKSKERGPSPKGGRPKKGRFKTAVRKHVFVFLKKPVFFQ